MYRPQLKTFLTVCETGSFSKAAAALFLTPSAVLQQVRALEAELGAPLFLRTTKGVTLTPAGEYLARRGPAFIQMSEEMRRDIHAIASVEKRICIGTSIMEKVRLLYELWVLFSEEEKDCEIQMVNIDMGHNIPPDTDLIESVNSSVSWMREWEFLEICRVPFGFAVVKDHPLAERTVLTLEDLKHETVVTINDGSCDVVADILELLKRNYIPVVPPQQHEHEPAVGVRLPPRRAADPDVLERYPHQHDRAALRAGVPAALRDLLPAGAAPGRAEFPRFYRPDLPRGQRPWRRPRSDIKKRRSSRRG